MTSAPFVKLMGQRAPWIRLPWATWPKAGEPLDISGPTLKRSFAQQVEGRREVPESDSPQGSFCQKTWILYIYTYTCICIYIKLYIHIHVYTYTCIHVYIYIYVYIKYTNIYVYTYGHPIYLNICIWTLVEHMMYSRYGLLRPCFPWLYYTED